MCLRHHCNGGNVVDGSNPDSGDVIVSCVPIPDGWCCTSQRYQFSIFLGIVV